MIHHFLLFLEIVDEELSVLAVPSDRPVRDLARSGIGGGCIRGFGGD